MRATMPAKISKRDAVADAPLGDLLAQPHEEHRAGGHGEHRDQDVGHAAQGDGVGDLVGMYWVTV